jgi:FLVCR family MFS transporter 7
MYQLLVTAVIVTVMCLPGFFVPNRPPSPPSPLTVEESEPFVTGLLGLRHKPRYWFLVMAFSALLAGFNCLATLLVQITGPYGYSEDQAGVFGAVLIFAGLVGAGMAGPIADRTRRLDLFPRVCAPLTAVGFVSLIFAVRNDNYAGIAAVSGFIGFFTFAMLPAGRCKTNDLMLCHSEFRLTTGTRARAECRICLSSSRGNFFWLLLDAGERIVHHSHSCH